MKDSLGTVFEKELQEVFKQLKTSHLLAYHRLTDSKASGNMVASQPSDYLLALPPGSRSPLDGQRFMFLEVKASERHTTLKRDMMKPAQRGAIGVYRLLLEIPYLILFWDSVGGVIELWDGLAIHGEGKLNRGFLLATWQNAGQHTRLRRDHVAAEFATYFHIPLSSDTLAKTRQ